MFEIPLLLEQGRGGPHRPLALTLLRVMVGVMLGFGRLGLFGGRSSTTFGLFQDRAVPQNPVPI